MKNSFWVDGILGLVVGDALGVPVQFMSRQEIRSRKKGLVKSMEAGGVYNMPKGTWSDDSSMTLATLASLLECGVPDTGDIMIKFAQWELKGMFTPYGNAFDEGNTCSSAIYNFLSNPDVSSCGLTGEYANGNGALMRILPVCLYYAEQQLQFKTDMTKDAINGIDAVSGLTHNHRRSKIACGLYYFAVKELIWSISRYRERINEFDKSVEEAAPNEILIGPRPEKESLSLILQKAFENGFRYYRAEIANLTEVSYFGRLFDIKEFAHTPEEKIKSSGYVIDSLEAAIWCLLNSETYDACMIKAVNLGDDTDTIAAIAGGLAGLYYGKENIPKDWLSYIKKINWILELCEKADAGIGGLDCEIVDIHMHVIPGVDDGSESMEMSMEMLRSSYLQGTRKIFCTSHGGVYFDENDRVLARQNYEELECRCAAEMPDLELYMGAEVRMIPEYMPEIIEALDSGMMPTMADTEYVLSEFYDEGMSYEQMIHSLELLLNEGYIPIIAHMERYPNLVPNIGAAQRIHDMGCLIQINAYSILEEGSAQTKQWANQLLEAKLVDFIGSDAHKTFHRPPKLIRGIKDMYERLDKEYVDRILYKNVNELILGSNLE